MQQSPLHNARTLSQPVKSALEQLLGRTLEDNEEVSVRAYLPHEAPSAEKQRARANELRRLLAESDEKQGRLLNPNMRKFSTKLFVV